MFCQVFEDSSKSSSLFCVVLGRSLPRSSPQTFRPRMSQIPAPRNRKRSRTMRFSTGPGNLHLKINEACPGRVQPWVEWGRCCGDTALPCTKEAQTDDSMLQRFVVRPQNNLQSLGTSLGNDQSRSILENSHLFSMEIPGFDGSFQGFPFNDFRVCHVSRRDPWSPRLAWSIMACILIMWDMCAAWSLGLAGTESQGTCWNLSSHCPYIVRQLVRKHCSLCTLW